MSFEAHPLLAGESAYEPPKRLSIVDGVSDSLVIKHPGGHAAPWSSTECPYMLEPMNMLASRKHQAVCFVGPSRSGKTAGLLDGWFSYAVTCDPGDMLIVQMSQEKAREYSKTRIDRAIRNSPKIASMISARANDDNTHDKMFKHGMWVKIGWPSVSQLSSSDYRYVALTDYDRMDDNIDGEGSAFLLGLKRTQTFLSRGMCMIESSPGRDYGDPHWRPSTAHEAPPTTGIVGVYNQSDRRRWYWQCPDCAEYFEAKPGLDLFATLPKEQDLLEIVRSSDLSALAAEHARIVCPHCGSVVGQRHKPHLNRLETARWVADGQTVNRDGEIIGVAPESNIAGYWIGGVAATYQKWDNIILKYLQALREYVLTGFDNNLKTTINTDQGMPYIPRMLLSARYQNANPQDRVQDDLLRYVVPAQTRCVVVAVDVQGGITSRFVVQAHAVGANREQWLIDRYEIKNSTRREGDELCPINPASHPEDWDVLTDKIIRSTYRTPIDGREIMVKMLVVDTGGEDGTTDNAYAWFRRVRKEGYASRVMLYKGASTRNAPIIKESMVGKRHGREKGDVPLYLCNPNLLSDIVNSGLRRTDLGAGALHFPTWLGKSFFDELQAEVRNSSGIWSQVRKRNESFDLCRMICAGIMRLGLDKIRDWDAVPPWLAPLHENSEVIDAQERRAIKENTRIEAPSAAPPRRVRRAAASTYL